MKNMLRSLSSDVSSGIVVFLVAIPLCLGVAVASGVSELSGIVAGVVGGILVGALSGSQLSVSGPAAGLTAIVAAAVLKLPAIEAFFLAVVISGVLQIIMGAFKLGIIGDYIPNSVIKGMLAGIGIILIIKQLPYLVGYNPPEGGNSEAGNGAFASVLEAIKHITPMVMIIGVTGLALMVLFDMKWIKSKKIFQILNGPLVVVLVAVLIATVTGGLSTDHLVNLPVAENLPAFVSLLTFPDWEFLNNPDVWITAITLALVASLETLLAIEAVDKLDPEKRTTPNNRELMAQGSGNIVSGLLGGLPLTSVIVRSSANINSGAKTKMSTIIHGLLILVSVLFLPAVLNMIPKAALAAVLIYTGYKLAKVSLFREYYKKGWHQFMPFVVTLSSIVLTDLLTGVMIGLVLAVFYIIRDNFRSSIYMVQDRNNYMLRLRKDISFFSKPVLKKKFAEVPDNSVVLIDVSRAEFVDLDITDTINEFKEQAKFRNITVRVSGSFSNVPTRLWQKNEKNTNGVLHYDDAAH